MRARLAASLIALVILVTGVVPAVAGYRCVAMGMMRLQTRSACCHHESEGAALEPPCCESYAAPRVEPRTTPPSPETRVQSPTTIAWIVFPAVAPTVTSFDQRTATRARGRPPGEQLQLFSTILRV